MTARVDVKVVLDWLRSEFEIDLADLPKGEIGECGACPVANVACRERSRRRPSG